MNVVNSHVQPGLALPAATPSISPAAPFALAAAVSGGAKSYQIANLPRGVIDQGDLPCCVSCALASAMEAIHPTWPALSPLFHYHLTRFHNGGALFDGSLKLDSGLSTLGAQGICRQDLHSVPFDDTGMRTAPSRLALADGVTRVLTRRGRIARTFPLTGLSIAAEMRLQLDRDRPVIAAFRLPVGYPDSFLDQQVQWSSPRVPLAGNGHCILVFGYSDTRRAFHVQDSRGGGRFDRGCWWMGYDVVDSPILQGAHCLVP